jgi:hypothetical protein
MIIVGGFPLPIPLLVTFRLVRAVFEKEGMLV